MLVLLPWLYEVFEPCDLVGPNLVSPAVAIERECGPLNSGPGLGGDAGRDTDSFGTQKGMVFVDLVGNSTIGVPIKKINYRSWSHHLSDVAGAVATCPVLSPPPKMTRRTWNWKAETGTGAWQKGKWMDGSKQQSKPHVLVEATGQWPVFFFF